MHTALKIDSFVAIGTRCQCQKDTVIVVFVIYLLRFVIGTGRLEMCTIWKKSLFILLTDRIEKCETAHPIYFLCILYDRSIEIVIWFALFSFCVSFSSQRRLRRTYIWSCVRTQAYICHIFYLFSIKSLFYYHHISLLWSMERKMRRNTVETK